MATNQTAFDEILRPTEKAAVEVEKAAVEVKEEVAQESQTETAVEVKDEVEHVTSKRKEHQRREWEAQGRDPETGQFVQKDKVDDKEAAKVDDKLTKEPVKAEVKAEVKPEVKKEEFTEREKGLLAEADRQRRRAQDLEARFAAQQPQEKKEEKTFWDDPEAALKKQQNDIQALLINTKLNTAESIARAKYSDFDEKVAVFRELASQTPVLIQQMLAAADPADYAYRTGKIHKELREAGSMDKLRADIETKARAEERAKVEGEYKKRLEDAERTRAAIPDSLSNIRGAATQHRPVFTGPTPFDQIVKR